MTERYFDDELQAWVTVCRPATAKGALTVEGFRGASKQGVSYAKGTAPAPSNVPTRPWTGKAKRRRSGNR